MVYWVRRGRRKSLRSYVRIRQERLFVCTEKVRMRRESSRGVGMGNRERRKEMIKPVESCHRRSNAIFSFDGRRERRVEGREKFEGRNTRREDQYKKIRRK
jgi:hypothetical protein